MIIGLCGLKRSGKDTAAAHLVIKHGYQRRAFADPLKRSVAALLDIPFHEIENFKNADNVFVTTGYKNNPLPPDDWDKQPQRPAHMWSPIRELTFRELLQRYGTEAHREIFGENFWVDQTLPLDGFYTNAKIVLTDCRFDSECDRVHKKGGKIILIERSGLKNEDTHVSERPELLDYDYKIMNNGTIEQLRGNLERVLEQIT